MSMDKPMLSGDPMSGLVASAVEYMIDAGQRSVLFLDILRRRGDQYQEHIAQTAPHVLHRILEDLRPTTRPREHRGHLGCGLGEDADLLIDQGRQVFASTDFSEGLLTGPEPLQDFRIRERRRQPARANTHNFLGSALLKLHL